MQQFDVTNTLDEKEKIQKDLDGLEQKTEINKMKFNKKKYVLYLKKKKP